MVLTSNETLRSNDSYGSEMNKELMLVILIMVWARNWIARIVVMRAELHKHARDTRIVSEGSGSPAPWRGEKLRCVRTGSTTVCFATAHKPCCAEGLTSGYVRATRWAPLSIVLRRSGGSRVWLVATQR